MKKTIYIVLFNLCIISCITTKKHSEIEYTVTPKLDATTPVLQVNFDYKSDENGLITLRYENDSWGDRDIFNCINNLEVVPKPKSINFVKDSSKITIKTLANTSHSLSLIHI